MWVVGSCGYAASYLQGHGIGVKLECQGKKYDIFKIYLFFTFFSERFVTTGQKAT